LSLKGTGFSPSIKPAISAALAAEGHPVVGK